MSTQSGHIWKETPFINHYFDTILSLREYMSIAVLTQILKTNNIQRGTWQQLGVDTWFASSYLGGGFNSFDKNMSQNETKLPIFAFPNVPCYHHLDTLWPQTPAIVKTPLLPTKKEWRLTIPCSLNQKSAFQPKLLDIILRNIQYIFPQQCWIGVPMLSPKKASFPLRSPPKKTRAIFESSKKRPLELR